MADTRQVHYLGGGAFNSRAACGRTILAWRATAPRWSTIVVDVTCRACRTVTTREQIV